MTPSLDPSHTHGAVLLPLALRMATKSLQHTQREVRGEENQAPVSRVFFLVMTNVQPNEISLHSRLELESTAHCSNASIFCRKRFACDGPRSDSGKSPFSPGLDNLPPLHLSHVLPSSLSPQTLPSATLDSPHSLPHMSGPHFPSHS